MNRRLRGDMPRMPRTPMTPPRCTPAVPTVTVQEREFSQAYSRSLEGPSGDGPASADDGAIG